MTEEVNEQWTDKKVYKQLSGAYSLQHTREIVN